MKYLSVLLFFCGCSSVFAEHTEQKNQVYNQSSQLTTDNINSVVKILRNPTLMSGNFREALKNVTQKIPTISNISSSRNSDDEENEMPFIELIAKVITPHKPAKIVLRVNDHILHLSQGNMVSQLVNRKVVNIRVDEITETYTKIFITPFEQVMVLQ